MYLGHVLKNVSEPEHVSENVSEPEHVSENVSEPEPEPEHVSEPENVSEPEHVSEPENVSEPEHSNNISNIFIQLLNNPNNPSLQPTKIIKNIKRYYKNIYTEIEHKLDTNPNKWKINENNNINVMNSNEIREKFKNFNNSFKNKLKKYYKIRSKSNIFI